jgi:hypothetical protein
MAGRQPAQDDGFPARTDDLVVRPLGDADLLDHLRAAHEQIVNGVVDFVYLAAQFFKRGR